MRYVIEISASSRGGYCATVTAPDPTDKTHVLELPGGDGWSTLYELLFYEKTFEKAAWKAAQETGKLVSLDLLQELKDTFKDTRVSVKAEIGS